MTELSSMPGGDFSPLRFGPSEPLSLPKDTTSHSGLFLAWAGGVPILNSAHQSTYRLTGKRVLDLGLAVTALVLFAPLILLLAVAVRMTSKGPVLFRQERVGLNGGTFELLKFRTMRLEDCDPSGVKQTEEGDHRVTRIGAWLRRTSLDELPQLVNVLKGEMSFCGPRPHVRGQLAAGMSYEEVVPYYGLRHSVLPGLTGWAQANGYRGPTVDMIRARARVDHDIAYIQNASLLLDIKIIAMTLRQEFLSGNGS